MEDKLTADAVARGQILIVDDDEAHRLYLMAALENSGHTQINVATGQAALDACAYASSPFDLAIIDCCLPDMSGLDLAAQVTDRHALPFVFLTGGDNVDVFNQACVAGAVAFLVKPVSIYQAMAATNAALMRSRDLRALQSMKENLQVSVDTTREVSIAIGILMERNKISSDEAYRKLRQFARRNQLKVRDIAERITHSLDFISSITADGEGGLLQARSSPRR